MSVDFMKLSAAERSAYKRQYSPGSLIRLDAMGGDDPQPIKSGTMGHISHVDDAGTIHMNWQNGRTLGLIPGVDSFSVVKHYPVYNFFGEQEQPKVIDGKYSDVRLASYFKKAKKSPDIVLLKVEFDEVEYKLVLFGSVEGCLDSGEFVYSSSGIPEEILLEMEKPRSERSEKMDFENGLWIQWIDDNDEVGDLLDSISADPQVEIDKLENLLKTKTKKPKTNIEFINELMEFSNNGALAQLFVIQALTAYSTMVANATPEEMKQFDGSMISGPAWQSTAREIQAKLKSHFGA